MTRDFDAYSYENDDFLMVIAAGNNGSGHALNTVGSPATAKNIISVGASQSSGPDISSGMYGEDYLVDFSGRGPTEDNRIKPDVVAPGAYILSAHANADKVGECDPPNSSLIGNLNYGLTWKWGTSMATPVVAGSALLIREYFEEGFYPSGTKVSADVMNPSGALVKAILLNGAQSLLGAQSGYNNGYVLPVSPYDEHQGFGRINLLKSLSLEGKNDMRTKVIDRKQISSGATDEYIFTIDRSGSCTNADLSVTLVWADPAAASGCQLCLVNDLDLFMKKQGSSETLHPNGRTSRDSRNNAERIRTSANHGDEFVAIVRAHNLATSTQKYSLVATGCIADDSVISITFAPTPSPTPSSTPSPTKRTTTSPETVTPTIEDSINRSLVTTFEGGSLAAGAMFDIVAFNSVEIRSMDIHTSSSEMEFAKIYKRKSAGSHQGYERRPTAWNLIAEESFRGMGTGVASSLSKFPLTSPISIQASERSAFYITLLRTRLWCTSSTSGTGTLYTSNADLQLYAGVAKGSNFGATIRDRIWNGKVHYSVNDVESTPTIAPTTVVMTDAPTLEPSKKIITTPAPTLHPTSKSTSKEKMLATTFAGGYTITGNMFDIMALKQDLVIRGMDVHIASTKAEFVQIYKRRGRGSYQGYARRPGAWTLLSETTVQGQGSGVASPIPTGNFAPLEVPADGNLMALYITLQQPHMLSTAGANTGGVYASNPDLQIFEGIGKGYGFTHIINARIWNGNLHYTTQSGGLSGEPSASPSVTTLSPTPDDQSKPQFSLATTYSGNEVQYGNMFDIFASSGSDISIHGMDIHTVSVGLEIVEVWRRKDTHVGYERRPGAWQLLGTSEVQGNGKDVASSLSSAAFDPIEVSADSRTALYVVLKSSPSLLYSIDANAKTGDLYTSNSHLSIYVGVGMQYGFNGKYPNRVWNGALHYQVLTTLPPSPATVAPTKAILPTKMPIAPTNTPVGQPTSAPTRRPTTSAPTPKPTSPPTLRPSPGPTSAPIFPSVTYRPGELSVSQNGLRLSTGLTSKIIATSGQRVTFVNGQTSPQRFHYKPDGAAVFTHPDSDGWVYVSNSEVSGGDGGVGAIYFNSAGEVIWYQMILSGTDRNCGGGKTPWNTWLTCEEDSGGQVWEVDPWGYHSHRQTQIGSAGGGGYFESVAYDNRQPSQPHFFVTEDTLNGAIRRFTPNPNVVQNAYDAGNYWAILSSPGTTRYLVINPTSGTFSWSTSMSEARESAATQYAWSEGIDVRDGKLYFTVKKWKLLYVLDLDSQTFERSSTESGAFNNQPDQIARIIGDESEQNILYFCEDGGDDCGVHGRNMNGDFFTIIDGPSYDTETTGLAFSPDKKHMYVSFQSNPGHIFDISREDGYPFDGATLDIKYHQMDA